MSNEWTARLLREFVVTQVLRRAVAELGIDPAEAPMRAALVATQIGRAGGDPLRPQGRAGGLSADRDAGGGDRPDRAALPHGDLPGAVGGLATQRRRLAQRWQSTGCSRWARSAGRGPARGKASRASRSPRRTMKPYRSRRTTVRLVAGAGRPGRAAGVRSRPSRRRGGRRGRRSGRTRRPAAGPGVAAAYSSGSTSKGMPSRS